MESYYGRTLTSEFDRMMLGDEHTVSLTHPKNINDVNVLGLIDQALSVENSIPTNVPAAFANLQAIDSATFIGQGASFAVYRRRIPPRNIQKATVDMGGWTMTTNDPRKLPDYVAYKCPSIEMTDLGRSSESSSHAMRSTLMEMYLTSHKPILEHANIVNFLGLTWGSNPFNSQHKTPILLVEYAQLGSLHALQKKHFLHHRQRQKICRDICQGLDILHRCGIVHGDMKAENILIFPDPEHVYLAKLSDFGHSLVCAAERETTSIGGTLPWIAPEGKSPVPRAMLKSTDIYSLGLLIWSVFAQGHSPFKLQLGPGLAREKYVSEAERLKDTDDIRSFTALEKWYPKMLEMSAKSDHSHMMKVADQRSTLNALQQLLALVSQSQTANASEMQQKLEETLNAVEMLLPSLAAHGYLIQIMRLMPAMAAQNRFYNLLKPILDSSVIKAAEDRSLEKILTLLQDELASAQSASQANQMLQYYPSGAPAWQRWLELDPSLQTYLTNVIMATIKDGLSRQEFVPRMMLGLTALQMNGLGVEKDTAKALEWYHWLFKVETPMGTAYGYRILKGLDVELGNDPTAVVKSLVTASLMGSYSALQDLAKLSSEEYAKVRGYLKRSLAGVGANHFFQTEMLHNFNHSSWMRTMENIPVLLQNFSGLNHIDEYKANKRGDRILHVAAASGQLEALKALLDHFPKLKVNLLNDQAETPLLSAARAGHLDIVTWLCANGGDASLVPPSGESPLHWLTSFEDAEVEAAGSAIIEAGGKPEAMTNRIVAHSVFQTETMLDRLPPGSPLLWACRLGRPVVVRFLLSKAEEHALCYQAQPGNLNPVQMAARGHQSTCLKTMIDSMHAKSLAISGHKHGGIIYGPIMEQVLYGANLFAMLLSNGDAYQQEMEETLGYLIRLAANSSPTFGNSGFRSTLLYRAASLACDEIVEFLLEKGESVMQSGDYYDEDKIRTTNIGPYKREHIHQPCDVEMRTPLLQAIHWNRRGMVDLLIKHGADIHAAANNPFTGEAGTWSALHVFAHAAHNHDVKLVERLIDAGAAIESHSEHAQSTESPLLIALQNDCTNLATTLLALGANANSLCLACGHLAVTDPTTPLGHVVVTNARNSLPRLRYLMSGEQRSKVDFVVVPSQNQTVLHLAVSAYLKTHFRATDVTPSTPLQWEDVDWAANAEILNELLQHYRLPQELNAQDSTGRTALHWAAESGNSHAVKVLCQLGAEVHLKDNEGETAAQIIIRLQLATAGLDDQSGEKSAAEVEARRACGDLLLVME